MAEKRLQQLQQFLERSPEDPFLLYALAIEYVGLKQDAAAEPLFLKLLNEKPEYLASYYHFGKLLERQERTEEALAIFAAGAELAQRLGDSKTLRELREAHFNLTLDT